MNHTALEIRPADPLPKVEQFPFLASVQAAHMARRQKWRDIAKRRELGSREPVLRKIVFTGEDAAVKQDTPKHYLHELCQKRGIGISEITGDSRYPDIVELRNAMVKAVMQRYPETTLDEASILFNRDQSTMKILAKKHGFCYHTKRRDGVAAHADEVKAMLDSKKTYEEIGAAIGYSRASVYDFIRASGWQRSTGTNSSIDKYDATIRRLISEGYSKTDISKMLGFSLSGVCRYIKRRRVA